MFRYLGDITDVAHYIIENFVIDRCIAIDQTLGNGSDCDFLSGKFKKVYAFDIQSTAIEKYKKKNKENVILIMDSHENIANYIKEEVDVAIYNLGFLPGGDKSITTHAESTLKSVEDTLKILKSGGFVLIAVYTGHNAGQYESEELIKYVGCLPKNKFGVMLHKVINRSENAPYLLVIEKK
ncbi:MAG: class I SAM-dependent methyltransferase [Clostridium sp.]|uniref:tRNA (mnm(5)s(2)U34)-methyltransferase n=1 Tax=Clostridium sp. TaxID=1506 RepID=UPI002FC9F206